MSKIDSAVALGRHCEPAGVLVHNFNNMYVAAVATTLIYVIYVTRHTKRCIRAHANGVSLDKPVQRGKLSVY